MSKEIGYLDALKESRIEVEKTKYLASLAGKKDYWRTRGHEYNSPASKYEEIFTEVLRGSKLEDLLIGAEEPIVIDLLAQTGTLADLFQRIPHIPNKKGIAVSLVDDRTDEEKERDEALGITHLALDLGRPYEWRKLEKELNGKKATLIMERGYGGLLTLPHHPQYYRTVIQRSWNFLDLNSGNLLYQLPSDDWIASHIADWKQSLEDQGIQVYRGRDPRGIKLQTLRLTKKPNSPLVLPRV